MGVESCEKMFLKRQPFRSVMSLILKGGWGSKENHLVTIDLGRVGVKGIMDNVTKYDVFIF